MEKKAFRSFTIVELLVVITTIAILALIAYPAYTSLQERAKATKDMNNLRQIGIATQMYMNDNDGALFSSAASWMSQLYPKYLPSWNIFISPFDPLTYPANPNRTASDNSANSAVSYGINGIQPSIIGMAATKISKPTVFILFASAQDSSDLGVEFQGIANTTSSAALASSPNVTVLGIGSGRATSTPGGTNSGTTTHGTHSKRTQINALFADLHCENMFWTKSPSFPNNTALTADPDAGLRWTPYLPYP